MIDRRELEKLIDHCRRNATGLVSPANSGLLIALALFELAEAQRQHTEKVQTLTHECLSWVNGFGVLIREDLKELGILIREGGD